MAPPRRPRRSTACSRGASRLDAQALRLRAGLRAPLLTPASLFDDSAGADRHRRRACTCRRTTTATSGLGERAHGAGVEPERAGGAHRRDVDAGCAVRAPERPGLALAESGGYHGPRWRWQRRRHPARIDERLPHAGQPAACSARRHCAARSKRRSAWPRRPRCTSSPTSWPTTPRACATFGFDSALATRGFAAVKTGTSRTCATTGASASPSATASAWGGQRQRRGDARGVGRQRRGADLARAGRGAARRAALARTGAAGRSDRAAVVFEANREAPREELFLAGTEQVALRESAQLAPRSAFGIASPRDGSRFALDPDIRRRRSRSSRGRAGTWVIDGKRPAAGSTLRWCPGRAGTS